MSWFLIQHDANTNANEFVFILRLHILHTTPSTIEATTKKSYNRTTAQEIVTQFLCPPNEELQRSAAGLEAFDEGGLGGGAIKCDDPRTEYTFDQFSL